MSTKHTPGPWIVNECTRRHLQSGGQVVKTLTIIAALLLGGCATCQQHPVACTVGAVVIAGTAVAMAEAHKGTTLPPPPERIARVK